MRIIGIVAATATAALIATSASAETRWDFASPYAALGFHVKNAEIFAAEINRVTGGEVNITVHGGASLYALPEIKRATRTQQIAIGELVMSTMENEDPIFGVDAIPFLANDFNSARILWEVSRDAVAERLAAQGLTLLYGVSWPGQGFFTKDPVESAADFAGKKLRTLNPSTALMAEALGAVPVRIESADLPQAMETGVVDAFSTSASTGADSSAWDYIDYFYDINAYIPKNVTFINTDMLNALSREHREAVIAAGAAAEARGWLMMEYDLAVKQATLCAQVECPDPLPAQLVADLQELGAGIADAWIANAGPDGQAIIDRFNARMALEN
ncbi:MAG: C4-dicarboxylate ABC transporter substrate-binding protein [Salinarimonadaceae bacterium]|nr:MAG: C4-dicarboxylate ABC transporter substrate-binding protein [Salinarimonadaceae bacterium]